MHALENILIKHPRLPGIGFLALAVFSLMTAYFVEYGLGIKPCEMCLLQRLPYAAVGLFALFAIFAAPRGFTQKMALSGIGVAFLVGMGLAFYHFGIEEGWWISSCSSVQGMDLSFDDLKASIMNADFVPCDQRSWVMFGLSITVYNTIFSLFYAIAAFTIVIILRKLSMDLNSTGV